MIVHQRYGHDPFGLSPRVVHEFFGGGGSSSSGGGRTGSVISGSQSSNTLIGSSGGSRGRSSQGGWQEAGRVTFSGSLVRWDYSPKTDTSTCTYYDKKFDYKFSITQPGNYCPAGVIGY